MIRNLKALDLALVAVFAMVAMVASAASAAEPNFTADGYPAFITGADTPGGVDALTSGGLELNCSPSGYEAELTAASATLTVTPTYGNCSSNETVTLNGCDLQLTTMEGQGSGDTWPVTTFIKCPVGKRIEFHVYKTPNEADGVFCTLTMGEQGPLTGFTIHFETPSAARITGTITTTEEIHGDCSFGLTAYLSPELHADIKVKCENLLKETTNCDIG